MCVCVAYVRACVCVHAYKPMHACACVLIHVIQVHTTRPLCSQGHTDMPSVIPALQRDHVG